MRARVGLADAIVARSGHPHATPGVRPRVPPTCPDRRTPSPHCRPAPAFPTDEAQRYQADPIGCDPAGPWRRHPPAASDPSMRPVVVVRAQGRGERDVSAPCAQVLPRVQRPVGGRDRYAHHCDVVQRPVDGRDHDAHHCDDHEPTHRPQQRPTDRHGRRRWSAEPCLSTAFLHHSLRRVPRGTRQECLRSR
jgi:hypothetical protein